MDCCMLKVMFLMDWVKRRQTTRPMPVWRREVEGDCCVGVEEGDIVGVRKVR